MSDPILGVAALEKRGCVGCKELLVCERVEDWGRWRVGVWARGRVGAAPAFKTRRGCPVGGFFLARGAGGVEGFSGA